MNGNRVAYEYPVGVLIVCARDREYKALQNELADILPIATDPRFPLNHFIAPATSEWGVMVVHLPHPGAGNVISGIVTSQALCAYNPEVVISFGIAGSLRPSEVKLNDVVYSTQVYYVDLRKDLGPSQSVAKRLPEINVHETFLRVLESVSERVGDRHGFAIQPVLVASSEAVIKAKDAQRRTLVKHAIADISVVEMEAYGVLRAAQLAGFGGDAPLAVAIKGISDDATSAKDDAHDVSAVRNAARFVRELLANKHFGQLVAARQFQLRVAPGFGLPRPYGEVKRQRKRIEDALLPVVNESARQEVRSELSVALGICDRPLVVYHWRLTCLGIHLVDLVLLRSIRRLADAGLPIRCMINDSFSELPHQQLTAEDLPRARLIVESMVGRLLGRPPSEVCVWYEDVAHLDQHLRRYAGGTGYDFERQLELVQQPPFVGTSPALNFELDFWFRWLAWHSRQRRAAIVLHPPGGRGLYEALQAFGTFYPALVETRDFVVAGRKAKTSPEALDLVVGPGREQIVSAWFEAARPEEELRDGVALLGAAAGVGIQTDDIDITEPTTLHDLAIRLSADLHSELVATELES